METSGQTGIKDKGLTMARVIERAGTKVSPLGQKLLSLAWARGINVLISLGLFLIYKKGNPLRVVRRIREHLINNISVQKKGSHCHTAVPCRALIKQVS